MAPTIPIGEPVTIGDRKYRAVREGLAQILAPYRENKSPGSSEKSGTKPHNNDEGDQAVFYNPIQQYNRDLSVLAILTYGEGALAEKEAKLSKRAKGWKVKWAKKKAERREKAEAGAEAVVENGGTLPLETSKKRKIDKVDEVDEVINADHGNDKRPRTNEQSDDDDILLVQQLEALEEKNFMSETNKGEQTVANQAPKEESTRKQIPFTILDALSASGLRAVRYAREIPFATNVIANDLNPEAVKSIELNIDHNELCGRVHSNVGDARAYMYSKVGNEHKTSSPSYVHKFDVIDLDPYGTAAPFLDAALQAVVDGGLLCVTCTDAGVFASNGYPEKAYALYSGVTMKGAFSHEAGLRLILHAVATSAAKYGIAIEPLLSLSIDFYARLFIRVHKSQQQVKALAGTTMITYNCDVGCGAWETQLLVRNQEKKDKVGQTILKHGYAQGPSTTPLCEHCGSKMHLAGPMWAGPIHNPYFIQRILDKIPDVDKTTYQTTERMKGMLTVALEEDLTLATSNTPSIETPSTSTSTPATDLTTPDPRLIPRLPPHTIDSTPFFFIPSYLAKILHCVAPHDDRIRGAIRHLGYRVTRSHCKAGSFKTNAPWSVMWEIMREWVRLHAPVKPGKVTKGMPGWKIMQGIRGTDEKGVMDVHESVRRALDRGVYTQEELKALLESALYRLEHPKIEIPDATEAETKSGHGKQNGQEQDEASGANNEEAKNKPAPKQPWNEPKDVSKLKIVFDAELGKEKERGKLVRYQINPRANWGPMSRAGG